MALACGVRSCPNICRRGRIHLCLLSALALLFLFVVVLDAWLPQANEGIASLERRASLPARLPLSSHSFTIIMQSYNRTDLLLKLLNHYQAVPHLHKVIVVWNSLGEKVPQDLWESLGPHPAPVVFKEQSVNRMRNRLQPFQEIETEAILMLDDDTLISTPDLVFAFSVWKQFPDQIVGFVPRKHVTAASGVHSYGSFELRASEATSGDVYSMVLIGAAFFHRRYLEKFQQLPSRVHQLIDETQNCDDIAMNFLVAKHTGKPAGIFVKPVDMRNLEKDASSGYTGMWHRAEHLLQRSYCLNQLAAIFGSMPLRHSDIMVSQFGFPNYANHKSKI
ncbi:exostosin-like 2 [Erpetoichthys calabaricus]|uniref:Exostosin-like 2 n=1 Tax=Erpetoichthys calabaricus TaxID=27687 RepID=A0A8C4SBZ2_ERPCA|nr:exostosin-like 2 [Erpetoichthys calabaricus]